MRAFVGPGERAWPRLRAEDAEFVERFPTHHHGMVQMYMEKNVFFSLGISNYQSRMIAQDAL